MLKDFFVKVSKKTMETFIGIMKNSESFYKFIDSFRKLHKLILKLIQDCEICKKITKDS